MDKQYSVQFFAHFVEAMQKFCRDYLDFEQTVELSGYLSLEIDNYKKERYVLSEMIHSTGDVMSESYCVKAFKTMKRLPPRTSNSDNVLRDSSNIDSQSISSHRAMKSDTYSQIGQPSPNRMNMHNNRQRTLDSESPSDSTNYSFGSSHRPYASSNQSNLNRRPHPYSGNRSRQFSDQFSVSPINSSPSTSTQGHGHNTQPTLEIQPRQRLDQSNSLSQVDSVVLPCDLPELNVKMEHMSSDEPSCSNKDKGEGDIESLVNAATSISSELETNSKMQNTSANMLPDNITRQNQSMSSIKREEEDEDDDIVLLDSPDDSQLEVTFGIVDDSANIHSSSSMMSWKQDPSNQAMLSQTQVSIPSLLTTNDCLVDVDKCVKNKFNWRWLDETVVYWDKKKNLCTLKVGECIFKTVNPGYAWCSVCKVELCYGSSGKKAILSHLRNHKHIARIAK